MRKCIIHIGMHKTGSTSIQASLNEFQDDNFYYARIADSPNHSVAIYSLFAADPSAHQMHRRRGLGSQQLNHYIDRAREGLHKSIAELGQRTLLLSGEVISALDVDALLRFKSFLVPHFDEISVVGYVRPPGSHLSSSFQTRVRSGSLHKFSTAMQKKRRFRRTFEKIDTVFGRENVRLWKFDPANFPDGDVVRDLCAKLGISLPPASIVRRNEGASREIVSLLFGYNKFCAAHGISPMVAREFKRLQSVLNDLPATKFRLSPDLIRPILDDRREDIAWMEARLGQSLTENLGEHQEGDIRCEDDLLRTDPAVAETLRAVLGDVAPQGTTGKAQSDVPSLIHAWRLAFCPPPAKKPGKRARELARGGRNKGVSRVPVRSATNEKRNATPTPRLRWPETLITMGPRPLVNGEWKLIVLWSPKAACTAVYVWFSKISGFADDVRDTREFPHKHRMQWFYQSDIYNRGLESDLGSCHVLRVIRDPYSRAVSIYRHALQTNFADKAMKVFSKGKLNVDDGYSFQQFLDLAESLDMAHSDVHFRPQFHPYEAEHQPNTIINLSKSDLFESSEYVRSSGWHSGNRLQFAELASCG